MDYQSHAAYLKVKSSQSFHSDRHQCLYTSLDGLLGIVQNSEFWITKWNFLNDSAEFRIGRMACRKVLEKHNISKRLIDFIENQIDSEFESIDDYYVLSFSLKKDSQLMWTAYANQVGICLGFEYGELLNSFNDTIMWNGRVIYGLDEQISIIEKTIEELIIEEPSYTDISKWEEINNMDKEQEMDFASYMEIIVSLYSMLFLEFIF